MVCLKLNKPCSPSVTVGVVCFFYVRVQTRAGAISRSGRLCVDTNTWGYSEVLCFSSQYESGYSDRPNQNGSSQIDIAALAKYDRYIFGIFVHFPLAVSPSQSEPNCTRPSSPFLQSLPLCSTLLHILSGISCFIKVI